MTSELLRTADGSLTCLHPGTGETYHAREGARSEAWAKFLLPGQLRERLRKGPVRVLEIGFGLGINVREAWSLTAQPGAHRLQIDTLEAEPEALARALSVAPDCPLTRALAATGAWQCDAGTVRLHPGDARQSLLPLTGPYDLIFHDPFSPLKNTECWTVAFFRRLADRLHPAGLLLTYSEARAVRAGLAEAGLTVGATPPQPPHRGGTAAACTAALIAQPLHTDAVPYRDPLLKDGGKEIRARREAEVRAAKSLFRPSASETP